jgi:ADP-heptose:LPS heptosyltransferase
MGLLRPELNSPGSDYPGSAWTLGMLDQPAVDLPDAASLIAQLVQCRFDAVIIFTQPFQSPYSVAYFSYLAGIPIRAGQSSEFGGSLLSHPVQPPLDPVCEPAYSQHLLESIGLFPPV